MIEQPLRRITPRTWALALLGNAALLLLGWVWLYIPDSHIYQFAFSIILATAILIGALTLHATLIRRLYPASNPLWQSAFILAIWLVLGHILQHLTGLLSAGVETRAGFWNSQLSAYHRATFTYERLTTWQNLAIEVLLWIIIPTLLLPFAVETVSRGLRPTATSSPWRTALATLKCWELWLAVALAYIVGSWLSNHLLAWHPAHSTTGELLSVALRTLLVYALAVALLLLTLAVIAELLTRTHARRNPTS